MPTTEQQDVHARLDHLGAVAGGLDLHADNIQGDPTRFKDQAYQEALSRRDAAVREALNSLQLDAQTAQYLAMSLTSPQPSASSPDGFSPSAWPIEQVAAALRLLQYVILAGQPIMTMPHFSSYAWAGKTLQTLYGETQPVAEIWSFFSGCTGIGPASVRDTAITLHGHPVLDRITLRDLAMRVPAILGPEGGDPQNGQQKPFFVKHLDPSDFPKFAYVGFRPEAITRLGMSQDAFKHYFATLLWHDRQEVETLYDLVYPHVTSEERFRAFAAAYKRWAIAQAEANWDGDVRVDDLLGFVDPNRWQVCQDRLVNQCVIRRQIVGLLHRIDYEDGQAIMIPSPTLHGIAGLSGQLHPNTTENYYPKDELWIFKQLYAADGQQRGWILVEPQRTFDKTESGFDFFTPFAWTPEGLGFRKPITQAYLQTFTELMDVRPKPRGDYLRHAKPTTLPDGTRTGSARWYSLVDEAAWPFFFVRELRMEAAGGTATVPLVSRSFSELHVTQGSVQVDLWREGDPPLAFTVTPTQPVLLPACVPYTTITYKSAGAAQLLFFSRH